MGIFDNIIDKVKKDPNDEKQNYSKKIIVINQILDSVHKLIEKEHDLYCVGKSLEEMNNAEKVNFEKMISNTNIIISKYYQHLLSIYNDKLLNKAQKKVLNEKIIVPLTKNNASKNLIKYEEKNGVIKKSNLDSILELLEHLLTLSSSDEFLKNFKDDDNLSDNDFKKAA